jgi:hypothetical protein
MKVYEVLVISVLLYNSETWSLTETAQMGCLWQMKGITRRDRVRNEDIKAELNIGLDVVPKIQRKRLRYFGHVTRMEPTRYPNLALYGRVHGTRKRGGQRNDGSIT